MSELNGAGGPQPMQETQLVFLPPQTLPNVVQVGHVPHLKMVLLTMHTPAGINYYFLDLDAANKIADDMHSHAIQARSGIIIAGGL